MMNPRLKQSMISLLLFPSIFWAMGCYSNKELTRLDPQLYPLEVMTKGNNRYTFESSWSTDSLGVISGVAQWNALTAGDPLLLRERVTLPNDSIASAYVKGNEIVIIAKDNSRLMFIKWMSDGSGGIFGDMRRPNPAYSYENWKVPEYFVCPRRIPADSIASIQKSEYDQGRTLLLFGGGMVAILAISMGVATGDIIRDYPGK